MKVQVAIFFVSALLFPVQVVTGEVAQEERRLSELQSQIKRAGSRLEQLSQERERLMKQLAEHDKNIGRLSRDIKRIQEEVAQKKRMLDDIKQQVKALERTAKQQAHELERQVKASHALGKKEFLRLFFNQEDTALSSRMLVYYDYLSQARLAKIALIQEHFAKLAQLRDRQETEAKTLGQYLERYKLEQTEMENVGEARKRVLAQLERRYSDQQSRLQNLKADEKKLQQLIASLQESESQYAYSDGTVQSFAKLKGRLPWPVQGRLIEKFGSPRADSRWDGVLIKAPAGKDVHAVNTGRVVFADWLRGYGLLTIIDHGKSYMTLYAFNQSLYKKAGDEVRTGEVIAAVGQSGGRKVSALYFGIRKKGIAIDPLRWCRKTNKDVVG